MAIAYDYEGAAAQLSVTVDKIKKLVRDNDIAARYFGRNVLIEHDELVRFVATLPTERDS